MGVMQMNGVKIIEIQEVELADANELLKIGDWVVLGSKVNTEIELDIRSKEYIPVTTLIYSLGRIEPVIARFA